MCFQIKIGAIGNAHQFIELRVFIVAFGEKAIQNINCANGVMREFFFVLLVKFEILRRNSERIKPFLKTVNKFLVNARRVFGTAEILHFHLLKFACAENKVAGRNFVAKRFADLRDAERQFAARTVKNIFEIDKNSLPVSGRR